MRKGIELLEERVQNEKTRIWGDERVMLLDNGKIVFSTRLKNIYNIEYETELNKFAKKVTFNKTSRYFRIER